MPGRRTPLRVPFTLLLSVLFLLLANCAAFAQGFGAVPPEELKMTSEPKAPGAPAIVLYREENCDDNGITSHDDYYVRIKILTEAGRKYGNVEIAFNKNIQEVVNIHARTVHPDGSAVEFDGKPFENTIVKTQGLTYLAKTFTLPAVEVGSVLEYRYTMDLKEHRVFSNHWILSGALFTRFARFSLKPYTSRVITVNLRWSWQGLPSDAVPKDGPDHVVRMEVHDIPAFVEEDFMPPPNEMKARVDFVYETEFRDRDPAAYWQHVGKQQYETMEHFIDKRAAMQAAVMQIVAPGDETEVKLRKIYKRVQEIRNKSYELRKSAQELKREKEKPDENVEDVWKHGYGNHRQLNWLYLALVRAAGFEASGVLISSRNEYFFTPKTMEYWKLNVGVVLVKLDGKDIYCDPGAEFNSFGMLTWSETGVPGLQLNKDGGTWIDTTLPHPSDSRILHTATFKLNENGELEGKVVTTYTGLEAMYHRLEVRNADDQTRKKFLEDLIRRQIAKPGEVTLSNQPNWTDPDVPLVAEFNVIIREWTSQAGKRTLLPVGFFTAGEKHTFEHENRVHPIYSRYPHEKEDDVTIELPGDLKIAGLPAPQVKDYHVAKYSLKIEGDKSTLHCQRSLVTDFLLLDPKYYTSLRSFYEQVRVNDDQQVVLEHPGVVASN
jgi:hypothetical protein